MAEIIRKYKLPNGREADVIDLTYGRARLCLVSETCDLSYDDVW
jgi:hypothetical protein